VDGPGSLQCTVQFNVAPLLRCFHCIASMRLLARSRRVLVGACRLEADQHRRGRLERRADDTITAAAVTAVDPESGDHGQRRLDCRIRPASRPGQGVRRGGQGRRGRRLPGRVLPGNGTATLGKVRDHLRDASTKWELVPGKEGTPGPVTPVVALMTTLWEGQRSRHAGTPTSRRLLQAEAEAVVNLAAMLVQWLHTRSTRSRS